MEPTNFDALASIMAISVAIGWFQREKDEYGTDSQSVEDILNGLLYARNYIKRRMSDGTDKSA